MNSRRLLLGCGIALVLGLAIVVIGLFASGLFPKVGRQPPPGVSSTLVTINLPLNGAELPLNEPVSIYAEAVSGSTVHDLELWVDGAFSPTKMDTSPVDRSPLNAVWLWKPAEEGAHRLIVRAIGPQGEVINSNVVRVSVLPREKIADLQVATVPPELLPPVGSSAAGEAFQLPGRESITPGPPPMPPQPPEQPQEPAPVPEAPGLQGSVDQCQAGLLIQDNSGDEQGFYLYRFDPTSTGFARVATLDKHPGQGAFSYLDPGQGLGNHTYYVASFNGNGEIASNLINLKVTEPQCAAASPQAFGLQDAMLTTSKAVDKVYCYLSVNGGPWSRIPPGGNNFIYPSAGGFDLSDYLNNLISPPPTGGVTLELECWGWSGNTLVYLGYLKKEIKLGPIDLGAIDLSLIGKAIDLAVPETNPNSTSPAIAPPYNVQFATGYDDCVAHSGGALEDAVIASICGTSTQLGYTILTWHWMPGCHILKQGEQCLYTVADITGYHIYKQTPGNDPVQVTYTLLPKINLAMIPPSSSSGMMIQPEYFVRAFKGNDESADSNHAYGATPKYTVTLANPQLWSGAVVREKFEGHPFCPDDSGPNYYEDPVDPGNFWVGYRYTSEYLGDILCHKWRSYIRDGHVVFDLSPIKGQVTAAMLRWKNTGSSVAGGGVSGLSYGCWIPLSDQNSAIIANYPLDGASGYDVTTQVRAWVQGLPNKGFALLSGDRSLAWGASEQCEETFGDFELEISSNKP